MKGCILNSVGNKLQNSNECAWSQNMPASSNHKSLVLELVRPKAYLSLKDSHIFGSLSPLLAVRNPVAFSGPGGPCIT